MRFCVQHESYNAAIAIHKTPLQCRHVCLSCLAYSELHTRPHPSQHTDFKMRHQLLPSARRLKSSSDTNTLIITRPLKSRSVTSSRSQPFKPLCVRPLSWTVQIIGHGVALSLRPQIYIVLRVVASDSPATQFQHKRVDFACARCRLQSLCRSASPSRSSSAIT